MQKICCALILGPPRELYGVNLRLTLRKEGKYLQVPDILLQLVNLKACKRKSPLKK
jgi:hypothetical protein